jgi:hypothetical protein
MGERLAEARRAKAESDTYHVPDDGDGFCEALNPSYDLCFCRHCEERSDEAIHSLCCENGLLRGACHRARVRATRWLAMTEVKTADFDRRAKHPKLCQSPFAKIF